MSLPSSLAAVQPFITRAKELENSEPVVSYYCKLFAVQQILANKLHTIDTEAMTATTALLDTIEQEKLHLKASDAYASIVNDDMAAEAYVEMFANRILDSADLQVKSHKASKRTAIAFRAAASFFEVLKVFLPEDDPNATLNSEILQKIKYCKFHATRILKALSKGEDPNIYEVESDVDETEVQSAIDNALTQPDSEPSSHLPSLGNISLNSPPVSDTQQVLPTLPSVSASNLQLPTTPANTLPRSVSPPITPSAAPPIAPNASAPIAPSASPPISPTVSPGVSSAKIAQPHAPAPATNYQQIESVIQNEETFKLAQKHAKFAISALNYDDAATAVKELEAALAMLRPTLT
ncbi:hypothetical protein CANCADRAFT_3022 [Tortispora caseinolytica NRRL Y-17796]|uniref:Vta1 C-terminal domain-containing protein n=1 Tax=Tortispora caseinolytica NRRL Y-17796 TaxID=767744 RepID=A0A1E4THS7_9ASCO|nr:hypothetical protein CANCADRAFT_3022 [Tortispora caseinolytica NRRL Y-17796]